jgi:chromate transport protein ChrA
MKPFPPNVSARISAGVVGVAVLSIVAYLPAVNNSFISDDFTMLPFVRVISEHPGGILEMPSEIFRVVSYVYFWLCLKLFGPTPEPFYIVGIALHTLISILAGRLVFVLTRDARAALVAALFFAVYERHQEAVMWISAVNDALLTLCCLTFLLLWERALESPERKWNYRLALGALLIALFSKEPAVTLIPLAVLLMVLRNRPRREIFQWALPPVLMLCGYVTLWLWEANRNFFVADGHYDLGFHFFPVYARSLWRVVSPSLLLLIPLLWISWRQADTHAVSKLLRHKAVVFSVAVLALTIVPYSFLTYLDHIPSRNTYLPSVGLAALMGILFAALYARAAAAGLRARIACSAFLAVILVGNVSYLWLKKEPQFRERAAPTRELLAILNEARFEDTETAPVYVCGFPLHESIGRRAVEGFTRFGSGRVAFLERCDATQAVNILEWAPGTETYSQRVASADSEVVHQPQKKGGL